MPWKQRKALDEKKYFIEEWKRQEISLAELCRRYEISRQTGYKWLERYEQEGEAGLEEHSRAPLHHPQAMPTEVRDAVVNMRSQHPNWGPRKLRACLQRDTPRMVWPAASSIGDLLRREGLAHPRRKRKRTPPYTEPLKHANAPNQVWCADFKGWFLTQDGVRCDPLTITDAYSRYLLRCCVVKKTDGEHVWAVFEAAFREFGLPEAIRTDNGSPFASRAPAGLSQLSMLWLTLGIRHERIEPGKPQQNGRHERMHQTLKQETASPPERNLRRQQISFLRFQKEYNHVRPHEALKYRTPASQYVGSERRYPAKLPELEYPEGAKLRRVSHHGDVKLDGVQMFVSALLAWEVVGLLEIEQDPHWLEVYYGPLLIGWMDLRRSKLLPIGTGPRRR
jgi:transposase InsO family protein